MYLIQLDDIAFQLPPEQIETSIKSQNETINLINESEVNLIKAPKLTEYSFTDLLVVNGGPAYSPFLQTINPGAIDSETLLNKFESAIANKKTMALKIIRKDEHGFSLANDTSTTVTLEGYTIKESAEDGFDFKVDLELKQYKSFGVKAVKIKTKNKKTTYKKLTITRTKKSVKSPYVTKKGQTLQQVAKASYGTATNDNCQAIYKANKKKLDSALKSKFSGKWTKRYNTVSLPKGLKLTIPKGK